MSRKGMHSKGRKEFESDVELNIASIVDCFTVLITYLLAAASFISIGGLDASLAGAGSPPEGTAVPAYALSMTIKADKKIQLVLLGKASEERTTELVKEPLQAALREMKERYPGLENVAVAAENNVEYEDMVKVVDIARNVMPVIFVKDEAYW